MPLFLYPLLIALLMFLFLDTSVRIITGEEVTVEIEIQPLRFIFKKGKKKKRNKKYASIKEYLNLVKHALPYSRVTVNQLSVGESSDSIYPFYRNRAYLTALTYPFLTLLEIYSKSLTLRENYLTVTQNNGNETKTFIDITFDFKVYAIIIILIRHFLSLGRRKMNAGRNQRNY